MPVPWVEDARVFEVAKDLAKSSVIQPPNIREFLDTRGAQRTVIVAPKGFGKTLLIKHKRKILAEAGYLCIPAHQMVELNPGHSPPLGDDQRRHMFEQERFWSVLWQCSICISVLKAYDRTFADVSSAHIASIMRNSDLMTPFLIFSRLLYGTTSNEIHSIYEAFQQEILPAFYNIRSPTALFIDNLDEFFDIHLSDKSGGLYGTVEREVWHYAQLGLALAVRELHGHNSHVKIYSAIRAEAYNSTRDAITTAHNLSSFLLEISYSLDDLRAIFKKNIAQMRPSEYADPQATDIFERFVGSQSVFLRHSITGQFEHIYDYILRHTLGRPRDLMTMGRNLVGIPPSKRTPQRIREAVRSAAISIVSAYIGEVSPHLDWFDEQVLFPLISSPILDHAELDIMRSRFYERMGYLKSDEEGQTRPDPFCDLYKAGLLGILNAQFDARTQEQSFEKIENIGRHLLKRNSELPERTQYLLHPSLTDLIRSRGNTLSTKINTLNIIGQGKEWVDPHSMHFVLSADIVEYSKVLKDQGHANALLRFLEDILSTETRSIYYPEHSAGDHIQLIDPNAFQVLKSIIAIANKLKNPVFGVEVRVGLDWGAIDFQPSDSEGNSKPVSSTILQRSVRLQSASAPGSILMSAGAFNALESYRLALDFERVEEKDDLRIVGCEDGWNIAKLEEEPIVLSHLYRLRLPEGPAGFY